MLNLKTESGTAYYVASGPLTHRDVATMRKHHWIPLMSGKCQMWWQGENDGKFLFNNRGYGGDKRVRYDAADPASLDILNKEWAEFTELKNDAA